MVKPVPAALNPPVVVPAPKINSFAAVVVAAPLLAVAALPLAPAVTSSGLFGSSPLYSNICMST